MGETDKERREEYKRQGQRKEGQKKDESEYEDKRRDEKIKMDTSRCSFAFAQGQAMCMSMFGLV